MWFATLVEGLTLVTASTAGVTLERWLLLTLASPVPLLMTTNGMWPAARVANGRPELLEVMLNTRLVPLRLVATSVKLFPVRTVGIIPDRVLLIVLMVPMVVLKILARLITL